MALMRTLILIYSMLAGVIYAAPVVSNVRADAVSHSSLRLRWDNSTPINKIRVRFGVTADYEAGPGGGIATPGTVVFTQYGQGASLSALAPDTEYHFCPQSSSDGGATWSECVDITVRTLPLPEIHPALPAMPREMPTNFPAQTGAVRRVAADCSDLQTHISAAEYGDTIEIPAGTVCSSLYILPPAKEAKKIAPANIDTQTGTITLAGHGFPDGQRVRLAPTGCLPGSAGPDPFCQLRGVLAGKDYYTRTLDSDHFQLSASADGAPLDFSVATFTVDVDKNEVVLAPGAFTLRDGSVIQVKSTETMPAGLLPNTNYYVKNPSNALRFQLSATAGGAPILFTAPGSGVHSFIDPGVWTHYIMAWPPEDKWIVVRTSTPDSEFCPEGVRCTGSIWKSKMATIARMGPPSGHVGDIRLQTGALTHNWRFIGIEFTHDDNSQAAQTTTDPIPYYGLIYTYASSANIVLDRCYIHGLGFPNRLYRAIVGFDGENMAILNSDLEKLDYWRPYRWPITGVRPSKVDDSTVSISAGTYFMGHIAPELRSDVTISVTGGTASGTAIVYLALDGTMHAVFPTGVDGSCSGYEPCTVSTADNPKWPVDARGRYACGLIATISIASGKVASTGTTGEPSANASEGAASFIAGMGPGPFLIQNNRISGTGIPMHFDDSGSSVYERNDYVVRRNLYTMPLSQQAGGPQTDHKRYSHRNHLEWKGGGRILVDGNIFENNVGEIAPGAPLVITPRAGGSTTDVTISNNTFRHSAAGIVMSTVDSYSPVSKPLARVRIVNNLFHDIDGFAYAVPAYRSGAAPGLIFNFGYAAEDITIDHNTVYENRGSAGEIFHFVVNRVEGVSITNNFLWLNNDTNRLGIGAESIPACTGTGKALMDCLFTAGPGNPSYVFRDNVLFPGYINSGTRDERLESNTIANAFRDLPRNQVISGRSIPERLGRVNFLAPPANLRLRHDSPYISGQRSQADGHDVGAELDKLEQAQGVVGAPTVLDITQTTATVNFLAPDPSAACYVLYGSGTDVAGFQRTGADTTADRARQIRIEGLAAATPYEFVVLCANASEQPSGSFKTVE